MNYEKFLFTPEFDEGLEEEPEKEVPEEGEEDAETAKEEEGLGEDEESIE